MICVEAIHHAARRYCIEGIERWHASYAQLSNIEKRNPKEHSSTEGTYSPAALNIFPRYNVLGAILSEVERLVPGDFASLEEAKSMLILAGEAAENAFTRGSSPGAASEAMLEERQKFARYIQQVTEADLADVRPLPYHRVINAVQQRELWEELERRWGRWYGGATDRTNLPKHLILQARWIDDARISTLRNILDGHQIQHLFEMREHGECFEVELGLVEFDYNGAEGFWTTRGAEWLVYASHEDSFMLGGEWLVAEIQSYWADWRSLIYRGWDGKGEPVM